MPQEAAHGEADAHTAAANPHTSAANETADRDNKAVSTNAQATSTDTEDVGSIGTEHDVTDHSYVPVALGHSTVPRSSSIRHWNHRCSLPWISD